MTAQGDNHAPPPSGREKTKPRSGARAGGRPTLPPHKRKTERVELRLTLPERETLEARAAAAGLDLSTYLRWIGLTGKIEVRGVPEANRQEYGRLADLGNLLRLAISTGHGDPALLEQIGAAVAELRLALIGAAEPGEDEEED